MVEKTVQDASATITAGILRHSTRFQFCEHNTKICCTVRQLHILTIIYFLIFTEITTRV